MHVAFGASLLIQVLFAVHAYRHGRGSPWLWIILCFPLVGAILYGVLFILPEMRRSSATRGLSNDERKLRRVSRGPFAPKGDRPDNAIVVESVAVIEADAEREDCPECEQPLRVEEQRAETIAGRALRIVVMTCRSCGASPVRYYDIRSHGLETVH